MKKLQQFFTVTVLTVALALSASAGDMAGPGVISPHRATQTIVTGDVKTPGATAVGDMLAPGVAELDMVTEAALSLLQGILSLF
jgi:hypothetical protein